MDALVLLDRQVALVRLLSCWPSRRRTRVDVHEHRHASTSSFVGPCGPDPTSTVTIAAGHRRVIGQPTDGLDRGRPMPAAAGSALAPVGPGAASIAAARRGAAPSRR